MLAVKPEVQNVDVWELRPWERNPRAINPERLSALKTSLVKEPDHLRARPLVALTDGRTIAGNQRLRAAVELVNEGNEEFLKNFPGGHLPTYIVDLDEDRAATWAIRDNASYGEWEDESLAQLLHELARADVDLTMTGFAADDIDALFAEFPDTTLPVEPDEDDRGTDLSLADVSVGDPATQVESGETWRLGDHLLVVEDVYEGWPKWVPLLEDGMLLVPYPTPTLPLTSRANRNRLLMIQPDRWLAGHVIDKFAAVRGSEQVTKVA